MIPLVVFLLSLARDPLKMAQATLVYGIGLFLVYAPSPRNEYSPLIEADEEGTLGQLKALRAEVIDAKIAGHRGRVVKNTGDGLLAEFASVVDAVRCAVEVQRAMADRNAATPPEKRIEFRVGINLGDVIATRWPRSPSRSQNATLAPSARKRLTVASPIPDAPPVTAATLPSSLPMFATFHCIAKRSSTIRRIHPAGTALLARPGCPTLTGCGRTPKSRVFPG
jgi:hypothetical protein